MAKKHSITSDLPPTMACMICGQPAKVRVFISDRECLVKVCLCLTCATMDADQILDPIYHS